MAVLGTSGGSLDVQDGMPTGVYTPGSLRSVMESGVRREEGRLSF